LDFLGLRVTYPLRRHLLFTIPYRYCERAQEPDSYTAIKRVSWLDRPGVVGGVNMGGDEIKYPSIWSLNKD